MEELDVVVIGAGLAGLTCAQQLRQAGYRVAVLEKSRGLGGRAATRRFLNTCADHGLRYLERQGDRSQQLIERLLREGVIVPWTDAVHRLSGSDTAEITADSDPHPRYIAPAGMSAIAKPLAIDLDVRRNQRVVAVAPTAEGWKLELEAESPALPILARSIVMAIPAPQALALLEPLADLDGLGAEALTNLCDKLRSVQFDPCITAIAVYAANRQTDLQDISWKALTLEGDPVLKWIGIDSSKRPDASQPAVVFHSTAAFAEQFLDAPDLQPIGQQMLDRAAQRLVPWFNAPEMLQVHRWRYAFVHQPLTEACLIKEMFPPIVCCGEWCGGQRVESALRSGAEAATQLENLLRNQG